MIPSTIHHTREHRAEVLTGLVAGWDSMVRDLTEHGVDNPDVVLTELARTMCHPSATASIAFHLTELHEALSLQRAAGPARAAQAAVDDALFPLLTGHGLSERCTRCHADRHAPRQLAGVPTALGLLCHEHAASHVATRIPDLDNNVVEFRR